MPTIFDCFQPVFARGLRLQEEPPTGAAAGGLRQELIGLIAEARRRAEAERKAPAEVERAAFAVVAWLDEIVADILVQKPGSIPGWTPLQVELFRTNNAGNEFFLHLRDLRPEQSEAREVYYVALCLGFAGEYTFDREALERIKREAAGNLPVPPRSAHDLAELPLTPQPYETPLPRGPRLPRHWEKAALTSAVLIAVLVPGGLVAYLWWRVPRPAPPQPQPPPPALSDFRTTVDPILESFECARLEARIAPDNDVLVSGFVASEGDREALESRLEAIEGAGEVVAAGVTLQPWPFCEVLLITAPLRERNQQEELGLGLTVKAGQILYKGDDLVVEIATPVYDAFLYLDYIQQDGWVGHIAHAQADEAPDLADDSFPYDTGYEVVEPFGREMIVLTASPEPLFPAPRADEFERAENYLPELRRRIEELRAARPDLPLAASHVFITTRPASTRGED